MSPSRRLAPLVIALAAWLGVAWLVLQRSTGSVALNIRFAAAPRPALVYLALAVSVLATASAVAIVRGLLPKGADGARIRWEAGLVGLPLTLALARVSGGIASPAVVAVALAVLALSRARGLLVGAASGALALLALAVGTKAGAGPTVIAGTLLVGVGLLPAWLAERGAGRVDEARRRTTQLESFLARRPTPAGMGAVPGTLRTEVIRKHAEDTGRRQQAIITELLDDVRELHGADQAIYWRFTRERDALEATAWTGGGARPDLSWDGGTHVDWAAREALPALDAANGRPTVAAVPILLGDGEALGALSIHRRAGLKAPAERLRAWLPRHAAQLARMASLTETVGDLSHESVKTRAIIGAALSFQEGREEPDLAREVCRTALEVTGATDAALVQWDAVTRTGRVVFTTDDEGTAGPVDAPRPLSPVAVVAEHCLEGKPLALEDARATMAGRPLLYDGEASVGIGSLGFFPLRDRDGVVHGAIVVWDVKRGRVRIDDVRNVDLLGRFASFALENVWQFAEVERRARTDQLTGLYNRRHFDEELKRIRALRNPPECSLLMADVDFFKKVNDTHGHDGGDAVLRAVASVFREGLREQDTCARFGGEEIAVLLPSTPLGGAMELAERLRQALERKVIRHATREIRVTASFGVATYPGTARSWDALLVAADKALYEAKRGGRNCVKGAEAGSAPVGS